MTNDGDFGLRLAAWITAALGLALVAALSADIDRHLAALPFPTADAACFYSPDSASLDGLGALPPLHHHRSPTVDTDRVIADNPAE